MAEGGLSMAKRVREGSKEQYWPMVLARWRSSGLSVRAYCELHRTLFGETPNHLIAPFVYRGMDGSQSHPHIPLPDATASLPDDPVILQQMMRELLDVLRQTRPFVLKV